MKSLKKIAVGAALALSFGVANAGAYIGQEVPTNLVVQRGNLEWVYASPCGGEGPGNCSAIQLHHGFGFATAQQWQASFTNLAALVSAFRPSQKCAASYFSVNFNHCDYDDLSAGFIWHSPLAASVDHSNNGYGETFLVRMANPAQDVPEPGSIALLGLGLLGLASARRKQAK